VLVSNFNHAADAQGTGSSIGAPAYRGTLVSVGLAASAGSNVEVRALWAQNNTLRGVFLGGALLTEYPRVHTMIANLIGRVGTGELHVVIDWTLPLAEAAAAHTYIEKPPSIRPRRDDALGARQPGLAQPHRRFHRLTGKKTCPLSPIV
jgi:NADPH:quinone reductase-like Zn-dependent oxidoreductase